MSMHTLKDRYEQMSIQVRATLWFLICSFFQRGISVITTPIFTRLLSTDEFGQFSVFSSWMAIFQVVITLNIASGMYTQGLVKHSDEKDTYASSMQGLTITLCSIWTVLYFLFHGFINNLIGVSTIHMLMMLCMIWATGAFNLWSIVQRVNYNYKTLVIITLLVSFLKPISSIILIMCMENKVTARILGLTLAELLGYSGVCVHQLLKGKSFYSAKFWKYAVILNVPLIPHALSQTILNSSDRIMISNIVGEGEAGIYNLAYSVSQIMIIFSVSLSQTLAPWTYEKIKKKRVEEIKSIAYVTMIFIAAVNLILIMIAPEVIKIFAPEPYHDAIEIIPPIAMATFFLYLYDWFARFEYYYEKSWWIMIASVTGAGLNIGLNWAFINLCGYYAAAYTTLVCYIVYTFMHYVFMHKICEKEFPGVVVYEPSILFKISIIFLIVGFALSLTYKHPIARYTLITISTLAIIVFRKRILSFLKNIMSLRKQN